MPNPETALPGTELLALARHTAFSDRYHKQHEQTLAWLQRVLCDKAQQRDRERSEVPTGQAELRAILAEFTGAAQLQNAQTVSSVQRSDTHNRSIYTLTTPSGLLFSGLVIDPPGAPAQGVVIIYRDADDLPFEESHAPLIKGYLAQGLRVLVPFLAKERRSFAEHPERRWYDFNDTGLLHLFFFIVGGSLSGLECTEVNTIATHFSHNQGARLPVALDLDGPHTLTAVVAAALAPSLPEALRPDYKLLVLHEAVHLLDHQEADVLPNSIWRFHKHFDALVLFSLATPADLLFVESAPTPSSVYSRARAWFASEDSLKTHVPTVDRLVTPSPEARAAAVARHLVGVDGLNELETVDPVLALDAGDASYLDALESKLAFLQNLHVQALERRKARYDHANLAPEEYRQRVAESIIHVAGSPLPEAEDCRPRTRLVHSFSAYDLYETVLESVPGVETVGYLMIPKTTNPQPAVICQHGLGGRPESLVGLDNDLEWGWVYDRFAQRLAEKGYVVYAPFMNWGIAPTKARDKLVKHAFALGWTPNRFEVAQLHAIVNFLQNRPEVIPNRIAFYGLSYGGHASVWLCSQEPRLCAVVTAGHFNDWHRKLTTLELSPPLVRPTSYISVDEGYDMFNYDVLNHLGHPQLVTRYAPRPYMVENGLKDTVSPTAWVNQEFEIVQGIFDWLGAPNQTELEHFAGPHRVWAERSFGFLHSHLRAEAITPSDE